MATVVEGKLEEGQSAPQPVKAADKKAKKTQPSQQHSTIECQIFLLDGNVLKLPVNRKVKGVDLVESVHTDPKVDIAEKDYFSLFFFDNKQKIFIDPLRPVKDQVPSSMKNDWRLQYGVKFYVSDPSILKEDVTRYQYCLQLCRDIQENRVLTDRETATRLTGLMLQGSLGDYDENEHQPGYTEELKDFIILPLEEQPENYEDQLVELHKSKAGYTPAQAESEFLQICKKLPRYGMHLYAAKEKGGSVVLIGISYRGIYVYRDHMQIHAIGWPHIHKISYKRHKFIIRYHPAEDPEALEHSQELKLIKFYPGNPPASKKIWKCGVEQHTFFRLLSPETSSKLKNMFRRGTTFRYSGRTFKQVQSVPLERTEPTFTRSYSERLHHNPRKEFAPGYVKARNSFRPKQSSQAKQYVVGKKDPQDRDWIILDSPQRDEQADTTTFEEQKVEVKFRVKDGLPDNSHKFVLRKSDEKYELERVGGEPDKKTEEPEFQLTPVDPESTAATTRVSILLDQKPVNVTVRKPSMNNATPIYDSRQIPDVMLGLSADAEDITVTRTLQSSDNFPLAVGSQGRQYIPSKGADDDLFQTQQVQMFLRREEDIMGKAIATEEAAAAAD